MLQLKKMTEADYHRNLLLTRHVYAAEMLICGEVRTSEQIQQICDEHIDQVMYQGFKTPDHYLFTLFKDQQDVGFLWYGFDKHDALLYYIYVHPDYRQQGFAQVALDYYHQQAKQHRKKYAKLHLFRHNPAARKLYQKQACRAAPDALRPS